MSVSNAVPLALFLDMGYLIEFPSAFPRSRRAGVDGFTDDFAVGGEALPADGAMPFFGVFAHRSEWLTETEVERFNAGADYGILVAKRRGKSYPGEQYAIMTLSSLVPLLVEAGYGAP